MYMRLVIEHLRMVLEAPLDADGLSVLESFVRGLWPRSEGANWTAVELPCYRGRLMNTKVVIEGPLGPDDLARLGQALRKIEQQTGGHYRMEIAPEGKPCPTLEEAEKLLLRVFPAAPGKSFVTAGFSKEAGREPLTLWAWVASDENETGVARLRQAWIPLGTINLAGFNRDTLCHPNLVEALRRQAAQDGQTTRLVRFEAVEVFRWSSRPRPRRKVMATRVDELWAYVFVNSKGAEALAVYESRKRGLMPMATSEREHLLMMEDVIRRQAREQGYRLLRVRFRRDEAVPVEEVDNGHAR